MVNKEGFFDAITLGRPSLVNTDQLRLLYMYMYMCMYTCV